MMNKQDILKKIGNIINELNEQHQYLSNTSKINILELELFTANADFLIDHIEILKKINNQVPEIAAPIPPIVSEVKEAPVYTPVEETQEVVLLDKTPEKANEISFEKINEVEKEQPVEGEVSNTKEEMPKPFFKFDFEEPSEMVFDFEKKVAVEDVFDRELTTEEQNLIEYKKKELLEEDPITIDEVEEVNDLEEDEVAEEPFIIQKTEVVPPPVQEIKPEPIHDFAAPKSIIEKPEEAEAPKPDKVPSLNEMLSGRIEQNNNPAHIKPITDLKSSISLNDKMFFIKELFNGYNLAYSEAIEILNRFDSFEAADNFLMKNYAEKNNWAEKQQTVDRLYEILNRKFKS